MNVVLFSTNTNFFDDKTFFYTTIPSVKEQFLRSIKSWNILQDTNIFVLTQKPGLFISDESLNDNDFPIQQKLLLGTSAQEIAKEILFFKPDIALSFSFWQPPFDWLSVQDGLICEYLCKNGVKTICNSVSTSLICFNKKDFRDFLIKNKFPHAPSFFIDHALFTAEKNHKELKSNPYKEAVFYKIEQFFEKNPKKRLIFKGTTSLSSYTAEAVKTFPEARHFLCSKKNNGNLLAEEFLEGIQAGTEIHGIKGKYTVYPPFLFSVNQYGITSSKQSVKVGPVKSKKYKLKKLKRMLIRLAKKLNFEGIVQVDLIFSNGKWHIIEVNPRLSGMTYSILESAQKSLLDTALNFIRAECENSSWLKTDSQRLRQSSFIFPEKNKKKKQNLKYVCDLKFAVQEEENLLKIANHKCVSIISQAKNTAALQRREEGFCQIVTKGADSVFELEENIKTLKKDFPKEFEDTFFNQAISLCKMLSL